MRPYCPANVLSAWGAKALGIGVKKAVYTEKIEIIR